MLTQNRLSNFKKFYKQVAAHYNDKLSQEDENYEKEADLKVFMAYLQILLQNLPTTGNRFKFLVIVMSLLVLLLSISKIRWHQITVFFLS